MAVIAIRLYESLGSATGTAATGRHFHSTCAMASEMNVIDSGNQIRTSTTTHHPLGWVPIEIDFLLKTPRSNISDRPGYANPPSAWPVTVIMSPRIRHFFLFE